MKPIRVMLVDDHVLFRKGIESLFLSRKDFEVVGEAKNGKEAIDLAPKIKPDVILLDIDMPVCSGLEAVSVLKNQMPETSIIMLTVSDDDQDLFSAIKMGADGYLLKNLDPNDLFDMIHGISCGEAAITGILAAKLVAEFRRDCAAKKGGNSTEEDLTDREIDVLKLIVEGLTNKEIAECLFVTEHTVKIHVRNTLEKLHLRNRVQAAVYAVREDILQDDERVPPS